MVNSVLVRPWIVICERLSPVNCVSACTLCVRLTWFTWEWQSNRVSWVGVVCKVSVRVVLTSTGLQCRFCMCEGRDTRLHGVIISTTDPAFTDTLVAGYVPCSG